ncbi:hypothetical protein [Cupriavidus necator]
MGEKLRCVHKRYRGMYVNVLAFEVAQVGREGPQPGHKWHYLLAVRPAPVLDFEMVYGPTTDEADYFTREAAEQAAIHYGTRAIDAYLGQG